MLTDTAIRKAKPQEKAFKLADSGGLYVHIAPTGSKLWRYRYRIDGSEKLLSIGAYPEISLAEARVARDEAKKLVKDGRDPSKAKKAQRAVVRQEAGETFEVIAREWHELRKDGWTKQHSWDTLNSLERDIFPTLGDVPIRDIDAPRTIAILREIEKRGAVETAHRIRQRMSQVFTFAISTGRADIDPAAIVKGAMAPIKKGRQPAITDLEEARQVIRDVDKALAHPVTKLAMRLLALTAVRPGTIQTTPWSELPKGTAVWRISAERMKLALQHKDDSAKDHLVPLSTQAIETIEALRGLTGKGPLAFPNVRNAFEPMSENALSFILKRIGYKDRHVPHGWRATFSTIMNERRHTDHRLIDAMLAHTPKDAVEAAYNRSQHMERRKEIAQEWADLLMVDQMPITDMLKVPRR